MPWCSTCEAYRAPSAVRGDGTCPSCGNPIDPGGLATKTSKSDAGSNAAGEDSLPPIPWHLKLLGVAVVSYLGLRAWQGIEWVLDRLAS